MSFLSNSEGQGCGAKSKARPTYSSPPALSCGSLIPLVSSPSTLWSEPSSLNKFSSRSVPPPPALPVCWTVHVLPLRESIHPGEGLYLCVWSLFSVSTRHLWTQVKGWEEARAVNGKLWAGACCSVLTTAPFVLQYRQQPASEIKSTWGHSEIKNNSIICRTHAGILKLETGFTCLVFLLYRPSYYSPVWNILKRENT